MWFGEHRADLSIPKYTNDMLQLEIHCVGTWGAVWLSGIQCFKNIKVPGGKRTLPLSSHRLAEVSGEGAEPKEVGRVAWGLGKD